MPRCRALFALRVFTVLFWVILAWQPTLSQAEQSRSSLEDESIQLRNEVFSLQSSGDYHAAVPKAERLLEVCKALYGENHPTVVNVTSNLADLYELSGRAEEAEQLRQQLASAKKISPSTASLSEVDGLMVAAKSYYDRGDPLTALEKISSAKALLESRNLTTGIQYAVVINELGRIGEMLNRFPEAEALYRQSVNIADQNGEAGRRQHAVALNNLGLLLSKVGRYEEALEALKSTLALDRKTDGTFRPDSASTFCNLGLAYSHLGQHDQANEQYQRALDLILKAYGDLHPTLITIYDNLANEAWKTGDTERMLRWQQLANDVAAKAIADTVVLGSERQKHLYMAKFIEMSNATISRSFDLAKDSPQAGRMAFESILLRKSRVMDTLSASLGRIRSSLTGPEASLFQEYQQLQKTKADWYYSPDSQQVGRPGNPAVLLQREKELLEFLGNRNTPFGAVFQKISSEDVRKALPERSALLEFVVYSPWQPDAERRHLIRKEPHYAVYGLKSSGEFQWWDLGEKQALELIISDFQSGLADPSRAYVQAKGKQLFTKIMSPLHTFLRDVDVLFIAPDGALNLIPFGALIDQSQRYLTQDYRIINYLSSGRDLILRQNSPKEVDTVVIVADPDYGQLTTGQPTPCADSNRRSAMPLSQGFERLCGTESEAAAILKILPQAQIISGSKATETNIKGLKGPGILHLATHGFFLADLLPNSRRDNNSPSLSDMDETLLRSGLIFAGANLRKSGNDNGILTALEAIGLDLTGSRLVVLSACETGLGEVVSGEGVFGLRRALAMAGAETQVMSLWKVSDTVTARIMARYYELLVEGLERGEALSQVQKEYLDQHQGAEAHPYYWAAFISSGDWHGLSFQ